MENTKFHKKTNGSISLFSDLVLMNDIHLPIIIDNLSLHKCMAPPVHLHTLTGKPKPDIVSSVRKLHVNKL